MNGAQVFFICYTAVGILAARIGYGRYRAEAIKESGLNWTKDEDEVFAVGLVTLVTLALWPLAAVAYVIFAKPPKTSIETEAENARLRADLERVERELGLR